MSGLLQGLRVVELAGVLAGPLVGQFLAELGADVVKVENPAAGGDVTRQWKLVGEDAASDRSAYFAAANWGKRSVALDLTAEAGRREMHRLAADSDIVITAFRPGQAERLGADAETLRGLNHRLIVVRLTGYGEEDARPGYDAVVQAEAGFTFMNGDPSGPPTKLPVALMDVLAAHQMKEGLLLALLRRERTDEGGTITVSLFQSAVASLANQASNYLTAGHMPRRLGSDHPNIAPYGTIFPTADGRAVVLAVGTNRQFTALCEVLDSVELATAPAFNTNQRRVRNRPLLTDLLGERIRNWSQADLLQALADASVPAGAVNDLESVFEQPAARDLVVRDEEAGLAGVRTVAFTLDGGEALPLSSPPPLGSQEALHKEG